MGGARRAHHCFTRDFDDDARNRTSGTAIRMMTARADKIPAIKAMSMGAPTAR